MFSFVLNINQIIQFVHNREKEEEEEEKE